MYSGSPYDLNKKINELFKSHKIGSAYQVSFNDGKKVNSYNYGKFDIRNESPSINENTLFDLASITKLYTSTLILKLHSEGLLNVNDKVSKYLPNFKESALTIIDLATHRVDFGISLGLIRKKSIFNFIFKRNINNLVVPKQKIDTVTYNNIGYVYLSEIIEKVTNLDFNTAILQFISKSSFKSTTTGFVVKQKNIDTPISEYKKFKDIRNVTHDEVSRGVGGILGHAGIFANANDLQSLLSNILNFKYYSKAVFDEIVNKNYNLQKPQSFGFWLRVPEVESKNINIFSHTGFTGGFAGFNTINNKIVSFTTNRVIYGRENRNHVKIWEILYSWLNVDS